MEARRQDRTRFIYRLRVDGRCRDRAFNGHLVDVTLDGMMLVLSTGFDVGSVLDLAVDLPRNAMGGGRLDFTATVRWCEAEPDSQLHALGVSLDDSTPEAQRTLGELMERFHELPADDQDDGTYVHNQGGDPFIHR